MFNLSIRLPNWFASHPGDKWAGTANWFSVHRHGKLGEYKAWELQLDYFGWGRLLDIQFDFDWKGTDHAAKRLDVTLLGFMFSIQAYDTRHWDEDANAWKVYTQEAIEAEERDYQAEALRRAYKLVEEDQARKVAEAHAAYLQTPEGKAEVAELAARAKEEKRLRGEAHKAANLAKSKNQ